MATGFIVKKGEEIFDVSTETYRPHQLKVVAESASNANLSTQTAFLLADENFVWVMRSDSNSLPWIYKYHASNLSLISNTTNFSGWYMSKLDQDDTFLYAAGTSTGNNHRIMRFWKSNMNSNQDTGSRGGFRAGPAVGGNFLYMVVGSTLMKHHKLNFALIQNTTVPFQPEYREGVMADQNYVFVGSGTQGRRSLHTTPGTFINTIGWDRASKSNNMLYFNNRISNFWVWNSTTNTARGFSKPTGLASNWSGQMSTGLPLANLALIAGQNAIDMAFYNTTNSRFSGFYTPNVSTFLNKNALGRFAANSNSIFAWAWQGKLIKMQLAKTENEGVVIYDNERYIITEDI